VSLTLDAAVFFSAHVMFPELKTTKVKKQQLMEVIKALDMNKTKSMTLLKIIKNFNQINLYKYLILISLITSAKEPNNLV